MRQGLEPKWLRTCIITYLTLHEVKENAAVQGLLTMDGCPWTAVLARPWIDIGSALDGSWILVRPSILDRPCSDPR